MKSLFELFFHQRDPYEKAQVAVSAVYRNGRMRSITGSNKVLFITIRLFMIFFLSSIILVAALADKPSVTALLVDYYEDFHSVSLYTYDSDSDGYDDSLTLSVNVDTDGGYVDVIVDGYLDDSYGYEVDSDFATWSIYGSDYE